MSEEEEEEEQKKCWVGSGVVVVIVLLVEVKMRKRIVTCREKPPRCVPTSSDNLYISISDFSSLLRLFVLGTSRRNRLLLGRFRDATPASSTASTLGACRLGRFRRWKYFMHANNFDSIDRSSC